MSKVVFVGNVPYNMGEEQLIDVFKSVGQVVGFRHALSSLFPLLKSHSPPLERLVFDRETGKPRGYGFCEFADHETALSAVRNLNNVDVGGRPLRIDLADSDPFLEGKTTVRGELIDGGETRAQWRERENAKRDRDSDGGKDKISFLRSLPQGVPVPPGASALDMISQTLATMNPAQLVEVLAQFKAFVITHPDQARALLVAHPQLAYALFQALLLNKIVDPAILQRMLAATNPGHPVSAPAPTPAPAPAPHLAPAPSTIPQLTQTGMHPPYHGAPPPQIPPSFYPPQIPVHPSPAPPPPQQQQQHMSYYGVPQFPPQPPPPAAPAAAIDSIDPSQKAMLLQVLRLTQEQISQLPPAERDAILALRSQLGSLA
ncbi:hinge domain of cleavage stimulation factor subunit 2-domain-containing protein [Lactarius akahatsu]|uniref:Hinge domain of cleavage stimulation factor subunit 2-domain-containing protein n=1 Tax=Lactarius akahatsu TaxID=416441 RepID=A0AAD4QBD2_9AGAM|nr:hinge domain of cleavage stimulation factor subunit 2-domain-containing protein [Lactarius akahatsu]